MDATVLHARWTYRAQCRRSFTTTLYSRVKRGRSYRAHLHGVICLRGLPFSHFANFRGGHTLASTDVVGRPIGIPYLYSDDIVNFFYLLNVAGVGERGSVFFTIFATFFSHYRFYLVAAARGGPDAAFNGDGNWNFASATEDADCPGNWFLCFDFRGGPFLASWVVGRVKRRERSTV